MIQRFNLHLEAGSVELMEENAILLVVKKTKFADFSILLSKRHVMSSNSNSKLIYGEYMH